MRPFILDAAADAADALRLATAGAAADAGVPPPVQYLAGGTNLLDLMKLDVMQPARVVSISKLQRQFGNIAADASGLRLGALVRMAEAADHPVIRRDYPVLAQSLWKAASPQLRNMATLGGNVLQRTRCNYFRDRTWAACNKRNPGSGCAAIEGVNRRLAVLGISEHCIANYPGDFANALAALGAEIVLESPAGGTRTIPFEDLHRLPGDKPDIETILQSGELITEFRVPAGPWTRRSLYLKIRDRESYDFALASAAVALDLAPDRTVKTARIGIGGLVAKPWRSHEAEAALQGRVLDETSAQEAAEVAFADAVVHSETGFKPELGRRTLVRALLEAARMEL
jgi:xanthine dehydrogenase YagS FAD-binding subunit